MFTALLMVALQAMASAQAPIQPGISRWDREGAVQVPFTLYNGGKIVLTARFGDREAPSQLDTGSYVITWPASLGLTGAPAERLGGSMASDDQQNARPVRRVILPVVGLGRFTALQVASDAVDMGDLGQVSPVEAFWKGVPLLPNALFHNRAITIDYERHNLTIYLPGFDPSVSLQTVSSAAAAEPGVTDARDRRVVPFELAESQAKVTIGVPILRAAVNGIPARLLLDTGWCNSTIGVCPAFYERLIQQRAQRGEPVKRIRCKTNAWLGTTMSVPGLADLTTIIDQTGGPGDPPYQITTDAERISRLGSSTDGVIGWSFLRHFRRVTIDYAHRLVYFEPWRAGSPQDRTGIFGNAAFATAAARRALALSKGVPDYEWDELFGTNGASYAGSESVYASHKGSGYSGELWDDGTRIPVVFPPVFEMMRVDGRTVPVPAGGRVIVGQEGRLTVYPPNGGAPVEYGAGTGR